MSALAHTTQPFLMPDRNPLLKLILKYSFYAQFCAGENGPEVRAQTIDSLKKIGFSGVILGYAKEVVLTEEQTRNLTSCNDGAVAEECVRTEINPWAAGTMETVMLASPGDYAALKFTGAGRQALYNPVPAAAAVRGPSEPPSMRSAGWRLSVASASSSTPSNRPCRLESTTGLSRTCASTTHLERAVIYGTYQAYLKATPRVLSEHLAIAKKAGFALGVKLVRGAYLGSDPRHLIHDTKADTDAAYDGIAAGLLTRTWNALSRLRRGDNGAFPPGQHGACLSQPGDRAQGLRHLGDRGSRCRGCLCAAAGYGRRGEL